MNLPDRDLSARATDTLPQLEARLELLEGAAARWRRATLGLFMALAAMVLIGQAPSGRTIEAAALVVRDPGSAARVQVSAAEGIPSVALHDRAGHLRAALAIESDGPLFSLYSASGEPRLVVGQRAGAAFVIVRDSDGAPRAAMAVQETGEPSLYLLDADLDPIFRQPSGERRDP